MIPDKLPEVLGRFDSVVMAHESGEEDYFWRMIDANYETMVRIVAQSQKVIDKYMPTIKAIENLKTQAGK